MHSIRRCFLLTAAVVATLLSVSAANAGITYSFFDITNNGNPDLAGQLFMEVDSQLNPTQVLFHFTNLVGTPSSICDIYFDDGALFGIASVTNSADVDIHQGNVHPGDFPGGNNITPAFNVTVGFLAGTNRPADGVDHANEWVDILFNLQNGKTYNDVIASLLSGGLRVGLHVQAIGQYSGSDSYVNDGPVVIPAPAAVVLGGLGLGLVGRLKRRLS